MNIIVTGARGFIGKNLVEELKNRGYHNVFSYDKGDDLVLLEEQIKTANFIYHLAGVNRPLDESEFMRGNFGFTNQLLDLLIKHNNKCPIMLASSIQASLDNPYGISKKAGENLLFDYQKETDAPVYIYRFPNVFGKWSRPNYNSVIATFCHNIAHGLEITIHDETTQLELVYIDDVVNELINAMLGQANQVDNFYEVKTTYNVGLGAIANSLRYFKSSRENRMVPLIGDEFSKKLYSTYLSFLPHDQFSYPLKMNVDERGSFTEFLKTNDFGQVSINVSKPHIVKGNHWHHTKNEKFLVVSGRGVIRFRKIGSDEVIEYFVSDEKFEVVDIPVGYTHNIENLGNDDMVTIMWANELFDSENPDTYFLEV